MKCDDQANECVCHCIHIVNNTLHCIYIYAIDSALNAFDSGPGLRTEFLRQAGQSIESSRVVRAKRSSKNHAPTQPAVDDA